MKKVIGIFLTVIICGCGKPASGPTPLESAIDDINSRLNSLESTIDELESYNQNLESSISTLSSAVGDFEGGGRSWRDIVPDVESETYDVESNSNDLSAKISDLRIEINNLKDEIERLEVLLTPSDDLDPYDNS